MSEALPASIVAQMDALGRALVAVVTTHRDGTLATLKEATLTAMRSAMPGLFAAVRGESTTSLRPGKLGRTAACPGCGERCRVQSWRERTPTATCGTITLESRWYHCAAYQHGWSPADVT